MVQSFLTVILTVAVVAASLVVLLQFRHPTNKPTNKPSTPRKLQQEQQEGSSSLLEQASASCGPNAYFHFGQRWGARGCRCLPGYEGDDPVATGCTKILFGCNNSARVNPCGPNNLCVDLDGGGYICAGGVSGNGTLLQNYCAAGCGPRSSCVVPMIDGERPRCECDAGFARPMPFLPCQPEADAARTRRQLQAAHRTAKTSSSSTGGAFMSNGDPIHRKKKAPWKLLERNKALVARTLVSKKNWDESMEPDPSSVPTRDRSLQEAYFTTTDLGGSNLDVTIGNPLKGLVPNPRWWSPPYASNLPVSLEFTYVGVDEVMLADPDVVGVENAFDWTVFEVAMNNTAGRNKHVVPRFHLHYPGEPLRVPQYLLDAGIELRYYDDDVSPYYGDEKLLYAIEQFLKAYGDKYDGDKRIAFVQVGMIGFWGEHHTFPYDEFLPDPVKDLMIQLHRENFNKTQVQSREPRDWALRENVGFHDDSFGHSTLDGEASGGKEESWFFWPEINSIDGSNFWRTSVMGGETRPEHQPTIFESGFPAGTEFHQDFSECARVTHATYMLHQEAFNGEGLQGDELNKAKSDSARLGYSFEILQVAAYESLTNGTVDIGITVAQKGIAPFYYPLNIQLICPGFSNTQKGVQTLIDLDEQKVFNFSVPANEKCFQAFRVVLKSPMLYEGNPIKFAQGDGTVKFSVPMP